MHLRQNIHIRFMFLEITLWFSCCRYFALLFSFKLFNWFNIISNAHVNWLWADVRSVSIITRWWHFTQHETFSILIIQTSLITRFVFQLITLQVTSHVLCSNPSHSAGFYGFLSLEACDELHYRTPKSSASRELFHILIPVSYRGIDLEVNFAIFEQPKELGMWTTASIETANNSITSTYNSAFICIHSMFQSFQRQENLNFGSQSKAAHDIIKSNTTQHRQQLELCNKVKDTNRQLLTDPESTIEAFHS